MKDPLVISLLVILIVAAAKDLQEQRIPNSLTFPLIAGALLYHIIRSGSGGFIFSVSGLALGIALFLIPYVMGGMGAGDVKLMGAVGAVLGAEGALISAAFSFIAGGVYAVILMVVHKNLSCGIILEFATIMKMLVTTGTFVGIDPEEKKARPKLCFAVAIAAGTFLHLSLSAAGYRYPF